MSLAQLTTIFTKQPEPGAVKTRLCPPLTSFEAAELAEAMLADTVAKCAASRSFTTMLCVAPRAIVASDSARAAQIDESSERVAMHDPLAWFHARFPEITRIGAQHGEGLGVRLANHFEDELSHGTASLVCIGSDAPHAPVERIEEAHARLEGGADLVLGPDDGGGYYLVALKQPVRALFTSVAMSTHDMCARTSELARTLGMRVEFVARDYDVDVFDDLARLQRELASFERDPARIPRTAEWIARYFQARPTH